MLFCYCMSSYDTHKGMLCSKFENTAGGSAYFLDSCPPFDSTLLSIFACNPCLFQEGFAGCSSSLDGVPGCFSCFGYSFCCLGTRVLPADMKSLVPGFKAFLGIGPSVFKSLTMSPSLTKRWVMFPPLGVNVYLP